MTSVKIIIDPIRKQKTDIITIRPHTWLLDTIWLVSDNNVLKIPFKFPIIGDINAKNGKIR